MSFLIGNQAGRVGAGNEKKVDKILIYFRLLELDFFRVLIYETKIKEHQ